VFRPSPCRTCDCGQFDAPEAWRSGAFGFEYQELSDKFPAKRIDGILCEVHLLVSGWEKSGDRIAPAEGAYGSVFVDRKILNVSS
jgi:hypothetical protein